MFQIPFDHPILTLKLESLSGLTFDIRIQVCVHSVVSLAIARKLPDGRGHVVLILSV